MYTMWSKHVQLQKAKTIFRVVFILFMIFIVSPLVACVPSPGPTPVVITIQPTATGVALASATATISPPTEETSTATAAPTSTRTAIASAPLTFVTEADARVRESDPDENFGNDTTLRADGGDDPGVESFLRFTVTGISDSVRTAQVRVHTTTNGSDNGPAIYATDNSWAENEITWNNRPARTSGALDNKDRVDAETWVEYDVTSLVTGNGTFSFVLATDSNNSVVFSSREGAQPPELVIMFGEAPTPTTRPTFSAPVDGEILVGAGDISDCDNDNDELTAQLLDAIPGTVFTTGDNAYESGTSNQFRNCYDPTWGRHKARTKPIPGNHEYRTGGAAGYFQYFDNIPSYYAYDLGDWRIYALNSEISVSESSPQVEWLQADLAANPRQCVLAYWHEPRWSSGSTHGSDTDFQTLWQIFYDAGAEVVLNGHEHNYERFAAMDASGQPDPQGLREFVVGTGGKSFYDFDSPLPTSEVRNNTTYGVLMLILRESSYEWQFIPVAGSTFQDSGSADCH